MLRSCQRLGTPQGTEPFGNWHFLRPRARLYPPNSWFTCAGPTLKCRTFKERHIALVVQKLRIIKYPDPRLRQRCRPVERVDEQTVQLAERMIELMHEAKGVGLAAPQVGVALRLFVCQPADEAVPRVFVNPVLRM